jgi:hypothetical protein
LQGEETGEELAMREKSPPGRKDRATRREGQTVRYTMTSPKVEAYLQTKLAHPEKIVLVKTGVFYLTFFEYAAFCHTELRLQVRNLAAASEPVAIPSCGFPVIAVEKYAPRLAAPSVDHRVLQGLLRRKIRDKKVLCLLDSLIATGGEGAGKGMPISNLTSQLFANVYLDPFDHFVKEGLRRKHYVRYMDDWLIMGRTKEELWEVLERSSDVSQSHAPADSQPTAHRFYAAHPRGGLLGVCDLSRQL